MPELLTGIVTFVFSDIEGSTRLLQAHPDSWPATLERHGELLRAAFTAEGGEEVGTEGDSFFFGFPTAAGAIRGSIAAQRALAAEPWPDGIEVNVRIGLHTGEASFAADSYAGLNVHRASRIAGAGHGGQVLLSDATRTLGADDLPDGVTLRDLGEHRLKDLEHPERLWQLVIPGCQVDFPPIRSLDVANNLPKRLTTFLGREHEIAAVSELLGRNRLLTLTGPGGTGKTRLSLEVASRTMERYPDGVFFVELAPITDPELVAPTIAQTLGLPDRGGRTAIERLVDHIGPSRMLLVLDNFEQVVDAASSVRALLDACPNLTMMASSRSVLRVSGEQEYPVPPLGLPDPARLPPLAALSQYEAVALFIERARAVKPDFGVTNENAPAVAEICVRLDGLPLAIELAAARIRILTPQAMLSRLGNRLGLLAGGSRDLPERQQTLRGAIAWSYDLLDEADRALFAGFSVFVGGAGLDAIEQVCGDQLQAILLDALGSLVEKSLLRQEEGVAGEPRFTMLETIRDFAMEQALERGRWEDLKVRHTVLFASFAERAGAAVMGTDKRTWLDRLEQDHDNLRSAFGAAVAAGAAETALRMGASLWRFWQMRGYLAEGVERLAQALAMPAAADFPQARADALSAAAGLAYWQADSERSRAWYREEIAAREALGDRRGLAEAHYGISFTWAIIGLPEADHAAQATTHVNRAREIFTELGDESGVARSEWALANVAYGMAQSDDARKHARHALEIFERLGDGFMVGWATFTNSLSDLYDDYTTEGGRPESLRQAHEWLVRSLRVFAEAQDVSAYTLVLDALALVALRSGDSLRAARLSGAVSNLERTSGTGLNLWNREVLGFDPQTLRSDPALADAWAAGEVMTAQEAVAYALTE
ncbi:MAG TPA: adenylate/guanylate cyclase domain-containing protein [Candidatus Limnocylindria bacterium]|nr:adenylate/guanylate cyclase domain-containing protein [Candidatus Limnocylindria bacterium]